MLTRVRRFILTALGVAPGIGVLFDARARRQFPLLLLAQVVVAALDALAVLAVLPLAQLLMGAPLTSGLAGRLHALLPTASRGAIIGTLIGVVIGGMLLQTALSMGLRYWVHQLSNHMQIATSRRLLEYYLYAPYARFKGRPTQEMIGNISTAVQTVYSFVVVNVLDAATQAITMIGILAVLFVAMPGPALALTSYFAISILAFTLATRRRIRQAGEELLAANVEVLQAGHEALEGYKDITLRGAIPRYLNRYTAARNESAEKQWQLSFLSDLPKTLIEVMFLFGVGIAAWTTLAMHGTTTGLSLLGLLLAAGIRVLPSVVRLASGLSMVRGGRRATDAILADVQAAASVVPPNPPATTEPLSWKQLRFDGVAFDYQDMRRNGDVISDVSFTLDAGHSLGIVGHSGAGKSTVLDLLLGFLRPTRGRITVDGVDLARVLPRWRASLGFVPQEVFITLGNFTDNIAFGDPDESIDDQALQSAIERAQIGPVIARFPSRLDAQLGQNGRRLSGGERQRVGIARALYRDPATLILDEATAALDNVTERSVVRAIGDLHGKVTVIVVAHRLSTVRNCDQILFLRDGRVAGLGTFAELLENVPDFAELVQAAQLQ